MRLSGGVIVLAVVWAGLAVIGLAAEWVEPVRGPLLIGLLVLGGLGVWAVSVMGELRRNPDEVQAEAIMREQRPGWENLPKRFREEWDEEEWQRQRQNP